MSNLQRRSHSFSKKLRKHDPLLSARNLALVISLLLITASILHVKPVSGATIYVPGNYAKIEDAAANANAGDTIQVAAGIYLNEHVQIDKSLTIVGQGPANTIVDGASNGTVFYLENDASSVTITGFTIRNSGNSFKAILAESQSLVNDNHKITNNIITTSQYGIYFNNSSRNTVFNNTFINNPFGAIYLSDADNTNITGNTITDSIYGVRAISSINTIIANNTITQTSFAIYLTTASTGSTIQSNTISGDTSGVYSSSDNNIILGNTILGGAYGIYLYNSRTSTINYTTIKGSSTGIRLYWTAITASNHKINNNKITQADWAMELVQANSNTFTGNWIEQNTYGIYMSSCGSNTIYRNNFVDNSMQASVAPQANTWDNAGNGNYWSDYAGLDNDHNGIGDTAYYVAPLNIDNYPLIYNWSEHDIAVQNVEASANEAYQGTPVGITVTVKNKANTTVSETFTLKAKYNTTIIGTQIVSNLAKGEARDIVFTWNTTGVAPGNYTISAEASVVLGELNTDNNSFSDGTVKVLRSTPADINGDGNVDVNDLTLLVEAFGSTSLDPNWNPNADLNEDNLIDAMDLNILGRDYNPPA